MDTLPSGKPDTVYGGCVPSPSQMNSTGMASPSSWAVDVTTIEGGSATAVIGAAAVVVTASDDWDVTMSQDSSAESLEQLVNAIKVATARIDTRRIGIGPPQSACDRTPERTAVLESPITATQPQHHSRGRGFRSCRPRTPSALEKHAIEVSIARGGSSRGTSAQPYCGDAHHRVASPRSVHRVVVLDYAVVFIEDLGITRAQLGLVFAVNTVGAAVLSPFVGRVTDRIGGRGALVIVACAAAVAFLLLGVAQSLGVLVAGSMIGAIAQAGSNPATNKLIAEDLPVGSQGIVTGIKQSGVQAFVFVGGMTVPAVALAWGRSSAYVALASFAALLGAFAIWFLPRSTNTVASTPTHRTGRLPSAIWWITGYGFLLGISGSATVLFALFTTESLGQSIVAGGAVTAVVGLASMPARILWARHAEIHDAYRSSLVIIALLGVGASLLLMVAGHGPWWLIWVAALMTGIGPSSWNSVGMLGLIVFAGPAKAGRASGVVLSGFLVGLGIGPPFFGWIVDTTGDYTAVWVTSMVTALLGFVTMLMWSPKDRPS